jgi:hypothetical protein
MYEPSTTEKLWFCSFIASIFSAKSFAFSPRQISKNETYLLLCEAYEVCGTEIFEVLEQISHYT